jgi:uncharacterized protein VirK/YbjX/SAM-dependent methyltransferase
VSEADIIGGFLLVAQAEEADFFGSLVLIASVDEADMIGGSLIAARNSVIAYWRRIWQAVDSPLMYPGWSLRNLLGKVQVLFACAAMHRTQMAWLRKGSDNAYAQMVERHPLLPALRGRPYLNTLWSNDDKIRALETHYAMVTSIQALAFPCDSSVLLAELEDIEPGLTVELDKPIWFADEGEVAINFFSGGERIYSLLFTLGEIDSKRVAYVGALQGRSLPDAVERYKRLTREAHGMRPRDFLFATFRLLCTELGVERIMAVSDRASIARSGYFKNYDDTFSNHDETWVEYGGVPTEAGFFEIPAALKTRDLDEVPSRKRAQYRRRYEMLKNIQTQIADHLKHFRWTKMVVMGPAPLPRPPGARSAVTKRHLKTRLLNPLDELWDRRLGIRTVGFLPAIGDADAPDWRAHYVPTRYPALLQALRHVGVGPDDTFVDYGCGLGRVVFAASWLGAKRAIGVEIDPALCAGAETNRRACRLDAERIEFACKSAESYAPSDVSVIYLFHPFGAGTLKAVLDNLEAQLADQPRHVRLVYENPIHGDVIDSMPGWRRTAVWPAGSRFTRPFPTAFWERPPPTH